MKEISTIPALTADAGITTGAYAEADQNADLASAAIASTGGSQSHTNLMPTLCIHFIVALAGIYPSRT